MTFDSPRPYHQIVRSPTLLLAICMMVPFGLPSDVARGAGPEGEPAAPTLEELLDEPAPVEQLPMIPPEADQALEEMVNPEQPGALFRSALDDMELAARRLGLDLDPSRSTQHLQEEVLRKLDELIKQLNDQQSSSSSSSSSAQPRPAEQPRPVPTQGQAAASQPTPAMAEPSQGDYSPGSVGPAASSSRPIEELRREWGNLPPRLRQELSESLSEPFSPTHRQQTEAYFRTLADLENQPSP